MATITEDYCSQEVYRLLREKGFDGEVHTTFDKEGYTQASITLQVAMKWLREVHSLHIWIGHAAGKVLPWYYEIHGMSDGKVKHIGGIQCGSYEVTCEAAIKYCLENLI